MEVLGEKVLRETAVVLCSESTDGGARIVLGLSVGERVLLALSFSGIKSVVFIGNGNRPQCGRAKLAIVEENSLNTELPHLVVTSDTIFDPALVQQHNLPKGIALASCRGELLRKWIKNPATASEQLGDGHASSGKGFAIRVESEGSARNAERALLLSLRKPVDGFVSTHLNRHVSLFCTRLLIKTGLPPNFFTVVFTAIGITGALFATQAASPIALVLAGLLFQGQSILDGCDGEMARLTYRFSRRGQWLDSIGDDITNYSVCFGLAVGQARVLGNPTLYWLGVGVLAMQVLTSAILYRRMLILGTGDLLAIPDLVRSKSQKGILASISETVSIILKRDTFIFLLSLLIILQQPLLAFYAYGLGTIPMTIGVLLNEYRITQQPVTKQVA